MNECKHRWQESRFAAAQNKRGEYMFECVRCGEYRYVADNPGTERTVVHQGAAGSQAAAKTEATAQAEASTG